MATGKSAQRERTQMSRAFSSKWSTYVQRVYGVPANIWVQRMAPNLATADASNLRNALQRDTFEGAMAELGGAGAKLSDDKVINILAASKGSNPTPQTLGALNNDLVYTPIQPCRIIDTSIPRLRYRLPVRHHPAGLGQYQLCRRRRRQQRIDHPDPQPAGGERLHPVHARTVALRR